MLVNDLLNLGGVRLECLEVTVLRENLNSVILAIWTSISGTNRVELVHSIHRACRIGQYAMVYVCRHLQYILLTRENHVIFSGVDESRLSC